MELTLKSVNKEKYDILYKLKLMEKEKEEVRINIRHFHERYLFFTTSKNQLAAQNQKLRHNIENNSTVINSMQTELDSTSKGVILKDYLYLN